jgi:O-acetyl-ADP-ribose deacetylase (regulator of RNase III)
MQDKYVADIGDFGKYCLLRELLNQAGGSVRLGINWYYAPHEEITNGDGNHISYLSGVGRDDTKLRACHPELYEKLKAIVHENRRSIAEIEGNNILPPGTMFYSKPIPHRGVTAAEKTTLRRGWLQDSLTQLRDADVIFLDPDNGIQVDPEKKRDFNASKYVFTDEIQAYFNSGKSLIIYNHRDRRPREEYERKILTNWQYVSTHEDVRVLRFKRVSVTDYIFLIQDQHRDFLNRTIARLTSPPYDFLFEKYSIRKEALMTQGTQNWTHPSVIMLAGKSDPINVVLEKARHLVLEALEKGWSGPPFDPFKLAQLLGVNTIPSAGVFDARTIAVGSNRFQIEYNPDKPRARTRFSLAHEIAHTLFPDCGAAVRNRLHIHENRDDDWQLELLCNIAASEFLMPIGVGTKLEHETVSIDNLLHLQGKYEVSAEAIALRIASLTGDPCIMFVAARSSEEGDPGYRIDYSVPSRSSLLQIPRGFQVEGNTILSECAAIGFTAKGIERWSGLPKMDIECVGIPPYPTRRWPRVVGIARAHSPERGTNLRIKYLYGDALDPRGTGPKIIAHIVNDKTPNWGAGFPLVLKKKWPATQKDFRDWVLSGKRNLSLGEIHVTTISDDLSVVHMIAQHGYGFSLKPRVRYSALKTCLERLASFALNESATVHMPRIGSGQAGGDWSIVADLIDNALIRRNIPVTVYLLPNSGYDERGQGSLD